MTEHNRTEVETEVEINIVYHEYRRRNDRRRTEFVLGGEEVNVGVQNRSCHRTTGLFSYETGVHVGVSLPFNYRGPVQSWLLTSLDS